MRPIFGRNARLYEIEWYPREAWRMSRGLIRSRQTASGRVLQIYVASARANSRDDPVDQFVESRIWRNEPYWKAVRAGAAARAPPRSGARERDGRQTRRDAIVNSFIDLYRASRHIRARLSICSRSISHRHKIPSEKTTTRLGENSERARQRTSARALKCPARRLRFTSCALIDRSIHFIRVHWTSTDRASERTNAEQREKCHRAPIDLRSHTNTDLYIAPLSTWPSSQARLADHPRRRVIPSSPSSWCTDTRGHTDIPARDLAEDGRSLPGAVTRGTIHK